MFYSQISLKRDVCNLDFGVHLAMARFPTIAGFILVFEDDDFLVSALRHHLRAYFGPFDCWCADSNVPILRYCEDVADFDDFTCMDR